MKALNPDLRQISYKVGVNVDKALSDYLETYEADEIFNNYFSAIRRAFFAGYKAAGGELPAIQPVFKIIRNDKPNK